MNKHIEKAFYTPCDSQEELESWVEHFLDRKLPEPSIVWNLYKNALRKEGPEFTRALVLGPNSLHDTDIYAMLPFLMAVHGHRSSVLMDPHYTLIRHGRLSSGAHIVHYRISDILRVSPHGGRASLGLACRCSKGSHTMEGLDPDDMGKSVNHTEFLVHVNPDSDNPKDMVAYDEFDNVACADSDGRPPIIVTIATQYYPNGIVQREIDRAQDLGTKIFYTGRLY